MCRPQKEKLLDVPQKIGYDDFLTLPCGAVSRISRLTYLSVDLAETPKQKPCPVVAGYRLGDRIKDNTKPVARNGMEGGFKECPSTFKFTSFLRKEKLKRGNYAKTDRYPHP